MANADQVSVLCSINMNGIEVDLKGLCVIPKDQVKDHVVHVKVDKSCLCVEQEESSIGPGLLLHP